MKLSNLWKEKDVTLSFEAFPPKKDSDFDSVATAVEKIAQLKPDFMSVTYGAGGGTSTYTSQIAQIVQAQGVTALAHLTCVSSTKEEVVTMLDRIEENHIENILALRGDIPQDMDFPSPQHYRYACELIQDIRSQKGDRFCIGGACYPEKHPESANQKEDIRFLKEKVDAGCEFLTTQMFFDNSIFYNFLYRIRERGIEVTVVEAV